MIKKITLIILVFTFSCSVSIAQTFTWGDSEETGYQMNPMMVKSISVTSDDGTVWFISMKEKVMSYQNMMGDSFIIKYDSDGNRQAEYIIDGTLIINVAITDDEGNLIISGDYFNEDITFWEGSTLAGQENQLDGFIAEISPDGNVNWLKNIEEVIGDYDPVDVMKYYNDKIYLGISRWFASEILTIDQDLNYETIITQDDVSMVSDIDIDSQGNIYLTGSCPGQSSAFNGEAFPPPFTYNKYLVKYNSEKVVQWVEYVEDVTCVFPNIKIDADDNIYWTGPLFNTCVFDTIQLNGPSWTFDFYIAKYTAEGNVQWAREIEDNLNGDAEIASIDALLVMPDNTIAVACKARGTIDWGNGVITSSDDLGNQIVVLNINSNGIAQWAKTGSSESYAIVNTIALNQGGDICIAGLAHETLHFDDVEIESETYYYPFITNLETGIVTNIENKIVNNEIVISPNPATNYIIISALAEDISSVSIFSINGRLLMENQKNNRLNIQQLNNGIYLVRVITNDGYVTSGKLVVQ